MLFALLSPAKKLDFKPAPDFIGKGGLKITQPALLKETAILAARAKRYTTNDIKRLMDLSPKLAALNYTRFQDFDPANKKDTKASIYAFNGDVYLGFQASSLNPEDVAFAQAHIGIISGLYGLLRPLDAMQPYRLEMGSKVNTERGKDLYAFWRTSLADTVNKATAALKQPTIINLASGEYWSAIDETKLKAPVIHAAFKEIKNGKAQIIGLFAKKARGMMARYIVEHRLETPAQLKDFDSGGYQVDASTSDDTHWVFSRKAVTPK